MTNFEKYTDKCIDILDDTMAIVDGKPVLCRLTTCRKCDLYGSDCHQKARQWLLTEYQEPKPKLTREEKEFVKFFKFKKDISIWRDGTGYIWLIDEESNIQLDDSIFEFIKKGHIWSIDSLDKLEVKENV